MNKNNCFLTVIFLMTIINLNANTNQGFRIPYPCESAKPENTSPILACNEWCLLIADYAGASYGVEIGAEVGGTLGALPGALIGAFTGGILGAGIASYVGYQAAQGISMPGQIIVTPGPYNPFDTIGALHNQLLKEFNLQHISPDDFEGMYKVGTEFLSPTYPFDYSNTTFKTGMRSIFDKTRSNIGNTEALLSNLVASTSIRSKMTNYINAAKSYTSLAAFNSNAQSLETSTLNGLNQTDKEKLQKAIAVARYSINFWNPWE